MTRIDELLAEGVKASRRRKARAEQMLRELQFLESTDEIRARTSYLSHPYPPHTTLNTIQIKSPLPLPLVPDTIIPLFDTLRQVPKTSDFIISTQASPSPSTSQPDPSSSSPSAKNEKRPWETSHDAFLAWGASKAIQASRKPSEARSKLLRGAGGAKGQSGDGMVDAVRAAEWLKGLEDAAEGGASRDANRAVGEDADAVMEDGERASNSQGST